MRPSDVIRIRTKLGLSQRALAKKLGASKSSIIRWENGYTKMHPVFARQLLELDKQMRGAA